MSGVLVRIKRAVLEGRYIFSVKAGIELEMDGLRELDALEAIQTARMITKTIRSRSPQRTSAHEKLYVIESMNFEGVLIYTKGKFLVDLDQETFYFLVSSKRSH